MIKTNSYLSTEEGAEKDKSRDTAPNSKSLIFNQSMPLMQNKIIGGELKKSNSLTESFSKSTPKIPKKPITNNIIISSHMMKQLGGDLPGQKVYQWDRLDEYKLFAKKINNEISEIEVEENESILSKETNSMINENILQYQNFRNGANKKSHVDTFENSLIKEEKGQVMVNDSELFNRNIMKSKLSFHKKQNETVQNISQLKKLSPEKNLELYKANRLNAEIEK